MPQNGMETPANAAGVTRDCAAAIPDGRRYGAETPGVTRYGAETPDATEN